MLQFVVKDDGQQVTRSFVCNRFPFTIGRADTADFQLSAPGIWDAHAQILRGRSGKLLFSPIGDAIVLINGERSAGQLLLPGDEVQLGGISLLVGLAPVGQRKLAIDEAIWWLIFFVVIGFELTCLFLTC